jgi:hypothetical protein
MFNKTVIANKGLSEQGKSASIKLATQEILKKFNNAVYQAYLVDIKEKTITKSDLNNKGDITVIIEIDGIKIGIESQGDPQSRIFLSLPFFVQNECDIIICACRNRGDTVWEVEKLHDNNNYDIIWVANPRSWQKRSEEQCAFMNKLFADQALNLIEGIINNQI